MIFLTDTFGVQLCNYHYQHREHLCEPPKLRQPLLTVYYMPFSLNFFFKVNPLITLYLVPEVPL